MTHKRLRKFLSESNHHLDENRFSKRSKYTKHLNEDNNNLIMQVSGVTKAESVEAIIAETETGKDNIIDCFQDEFRDNINDAIEETIEKLLLSKIELPSSSLNKSTITALEKLFNLILNINQDDLHDVKLINYVRL